MPINSFFVVFIFLANCSQQKHANDPNALPETKISTRVVVNNLSNPWEILWGPDDYIWMTERDGKISRVNPSNGTVTKLLTEAAVEARGEGGLLGMVLHPDFKTSPYVYVSYNYDESGKYKERVVRYTYDGTTLSKPSIVFDNINASGIHNGSRLYISNDLKLFITTGDASNQSQPQNNAFVNGKILRINLDGSIPADNPIAGNALWTKGHRNPQGLVFANNILYSSEHGPSSDDEINIIEKGRNYGWPDVEGICNSGESDFCKANNVKEPIKAWTPTVAVSGLDFYDKDLLPEWKNSLLLCTLKASRLIQLKLNSSNNAVVETNEYLVNEYGRLRDICISPAGKVYVCSGNGSNDKIVEITKK